MNLTVDPQNSDTKIFLGRISITKNNAKTARKEAVLDAAAGGNH